MKTIFSISLNYVLRWIYGIADLLGAPTSVIRVPLPYQVARLTPKDAGLDYINVEVRSELGINPAWHVPALSDKWVIMVHGRGGDRVGSIDMLPIFHKLGYNTLVITYRNDLAAPMSPDGLDHLGATEWRDLEAAVDYARMHGAEDITLFGRSAGGAIIGQYLTRSIEAYLINRVVLDNPVMDWEPVFLKAAPRWLPRWVGRLIVWGNMRRIGARTKQFNLADHPPLNRPPTLILHSTADETCPVQVSRRVVEMRPDNWNVVLVEMEGGHEGGRFADTENYLGLIVAWLYPERWEKTLLAESLEQMAAGEGTVRVSA
jgi:pimeloyl-ACP methyl ester carboxylesterase